MKIVVLISIFAVLSAIKLETSSFYGVTIDFEIIEIPQDKKSEALDNPNIMAIGSFIDDRNSSGWTFLTVNTSAKHPDYAQAMAAGYLEGFLGYRLVHDTYLNEKVLLGEPSSDIFEYMTNQTLWVEEQVALNPQSNYWHAHQHYNELISRSLHWIYRRCCPQ